MSCHTWPWLYFWKVSWILIQQPSEVGIATCETKYKRDLMTLQSYISSIKAGGTQICVMNLKSKLLGPSCPNTCSHRQTPRGIKFWYLTGCTLLCCSHNILCIIILITNLLCVTSTKVSMVKIILHNSLLNLSVTFPWFWKTDEDTETQKFSQ